MMNADGGVFNFVDNVVGSITNEQYSLKLLFSFPGLNQHMGVVNDGEVTGEKYHSGDLLNPGVKKVHFLGCLGGLSDS